MARRTNIVSFNDARNESRRGPSASKQRTRKPSDEAINRAYATASSVRDRRATQGSRSRRSFFADETESNEETRSTRQSSSRAAVTRADAGESSRDRRRRERTKERADRMFQRQFASDSASSATDENAPRAALYEGKMGAKHRKSARMQRSSQAGSAAAKLNPAGWLAYLPFTARSLKIATGVICALLVCVFLYTPAQQYYQATRERDKLAAEYSIIEERNHALDAQNDVLASDAGLEDAVRQKYGYVKVGESTAVVTGLSENATDTSRDSEDLEPAVLSSSVKAPTEWYTPLLDTFFGVE